MKLQHPFKIRAAVFLLGLGWALVCGSAPVHAQRASLQRELSPFIQANVAVPLAVGSVPSTSSMSGLRPKIMLVGYWPPSNAELLPFSDNQAQYPVVWIGSNW